MMEPAKKRCLVNNMVKKYKSMNPEEKQDPSG